MTSSDGADYYFECTPNEQIAQRCFVEAMSSVKNLSTLSFLAGESENAFKIRGLLLGVERATYDQLYLLKVAPELTGTDLWKRSSVALEQIHRCQKIAREETECVELSSVLKSSFQALASDLPAADLDLIPTQRTALVHKFFGQAALCRRLKHDKMPNITQQRKILCNSISNARERHAQCLEEKGSVAASRQRFVQVKDVASAYRITMAKRSSTSISNSIGKESMCIANSLEKEPTSNDAKKRRTATRATTTDATGTTTRATTRAMTVANKVAPSTTSATNAPSTAHRLLPATRATEPKQRSPAEVMTSNVRQTNPGTDNKFFWKSKGVTVAPKGCEAKEYTNSLFEDNLYKNVYYITTAHAIFAMIHGAIDKLSKKPSRYLWHNFAKSKFGRTYHWEGWMIMLISPRTKDTRVRLIWDTIVKAYPNPAALLKAFVEDADACYNQLVNACGTIFGRLKAANVITSTYIFEQSQCYSEAAATAMHSFIHKKVGAPRFKSPFDTILDIEEAIVMFSKHNNAGLLPQFAEILQTSPGTGPKISNCVMEMCYNKVDAAAIDSHGLHVRYLGFVPPTDKTEKEVAAHLGMLFSGGMLLWFNRTMGGAGQILRGELGLKSKQQFIRMLKSGAAELGVSWYINNWLLLGYKTS
jgi:endonuclease III